ncbi:DUF1616 domain-containing protein [Halobaculum sp. EA56]|uniref:DUF1616 domain-containing protein n=1 Tax=Halobaculum sp. EA56 TaxID=3421648 RepID=UPI003EBD5BDB
MSAADRSRAGGLLVVADALATLAAVWILALAVLGGIGGPIRAVAGGALVLFAPGYAVSTALFPATDDGGSGTGSPRRAALPFAERLAFGVGASVASVPVLAWAVARLGYPYTVATTAGAVAAVASVFVVVGCVRRLRTAPEHRYLPPAGPAAALAVDASRRSSPGRASTVVFVVAVATAVAVVTAGLVAPIQGDGYTQVSVLTEGEDGRQFVDETPATVAAGGSVDLVLRVENHEREETRYVVVVQLQRVVDGEVVERANADRFSRTVAPNGTWERPHEVRPFDGENVRVAYLVYRGDPPPTPGVDSAYRSVTVWTTVSDGSTAGTGDPASIDESRPADGAAAAYGSAPASGAATRSTGVTAP